VTKQPSFASRLAVTIAAPIAVMLASSHVPLPGVDMGRLGPTLSGAPLFDLGVFDLGLTPAVSAYVLVELVALVVPRWARLRHVPDGRAKIERAARFMMIVLAAVQAFGIVSSLRAHDVDVFVPPFGALIAGVTLVAGTALLFALASFVTRRGLVNGFALLLATGWVQDLVTSFTRQTTGSQGRLVEPREAPLFFSCVAIIAAATLVCAARSESAETPRAGAAPFRGGATRAAPSPWIPVPASSFYPISAVSVLISFAMGARGFDVRGAEEALTHEPTATLVRLVLACVIGIVIAFVLHRADDVASFVRRLGTPPERAAAEGRAAFSRAILPTLLFLCAISLAQSIGTGLPHIHVATVQIPLMVAVLYDLVVSARDLVRAPDLVCAWEERRPYAVAAIRTTLGEDGIPTRARGMGLSTMLQAFGPYAPVEILVPAEHAEYASARLRHLFLGDPEPRPRTEEAMPKPASAATLSLKTRAAILGALALMGCGLAIVARHPYEEADGPLVRAKLEIVSVDDETDPFPTSDDGLPEGVAIYTENVPAGEGHYAQGRFARVVPREGEPLAEALGRVGGWLHTLPLPPGERFAFADVVDRDEDTGAEHVVGARTYLLRGQPIVTEDDIEDADVAFPTTDLLPEPYVAVVFKPAGAERFRIGTRENVQRRIAIVLDEHIDSVPVVKQEITGGRVSITLGASPDPERLIPRAKRLARSLRGR
jgi:hypothetical protein